MDRSPLYLAALASAAVPGLDPASVEALPSEPGQLFDVAFVQDTQHRRWVVRAPRTQAAGAQMDVTVALLGLLARRLPFSVPTPKGFAALLQGGRAAVYPYLPGQNIDFSALPPGPGLAAELGRTIAALHNADHQLFDEAGLPAYDADTYRSRRLSELDRAAATGHVPTALLTRWEHALEDVSLWRFAPTPTHGDLTGDQVLAVFDGDGDAAPPPSCPIPMPIAMASTTAAPTRAGRSEPPSKPRRRAPIGVRATEGAPSRSFASRSTTSISERLRLGGGSTCSTERGSRSAAGRRRSTSCRHSGQSTRCSSNEARSESDRAPSR